MFLCSIKLTGRHWGTDGGLQKRQWLWHSVLCAHVGVCVGVCLCLNWQNCSSQSL